MGTDPDFRYALLPIRRLKHSSEKCSLQRYECLETGGFFLFILTNHARRSFLYLIGKECHDSFVHLGLLLRLTHPYAIQCLAILSTIKLGRRNLKLLERKRRKQSRIKKSHSSLVRNSCFDPKASFSRLLKLTPQRRGLNCNNSYSALPLKEKNKF